MKGKTTTLTLIAPTPAALTYFPSFPHALFATGSQEEYMYLAEWGSCHALPYLLYDSADAW